MKNADAIRRQARQSEPISDDEAERLVLRAKGKDAKALEELVERYSRLTVKMATGFATPDNLFDDLMQEGAIVLMACVQRYTAGRSFGRYYTKALRNRFCRMAKAEGRTSERWAGSLDVDDEDAPEPVDESAEMQFVELVAAPRDEERKRKIERDVGARDTFIVKLLSGVETGRSQSPAAVAAVMGVSIWDARQAIKQARERYRSVCEASQ